MSDIASFLGPAAQNRIAGAITVVHPAFERDTYLAAVLPGIMDIPLKERMRKSTHSLHDALQLPYRDAVNIIVKALPQMAGDFKGMVMADYVEVYGLEDFAWSLGALKDMTQFGSAEFAIRVYLAADFGRAYAAMQNWASDKNEHVRRLASEGLRPRLPWSFQLKDLMRDPTPSFELLAKLMADDSKYVRTSVANHLNDISKDNPERLIDFLDAHDQSNPDTRWITKKALRSLIKAAHPRALMFLGFTASPELTLAAFKLSSYKIQVGETINFDFTLTSNAKVQQKLAIDYIVHFMKANGKQAEKVFKLRELTLGAGETLRIKKSHPFRHFSTRKLYPGEHKIEVMVNGQRMSKRLVNLTF